MNPVDRCTARRGSALIISMVLVLIVAAMSVALMTDTFSRGRWARATMEREEARAICDAGLARAQRALYQYRENGTWDWDDLLAYCSQAPSAPEDVLAAYEAAANTPWFASYRGRMDEPGIHTAVKNEAPVAPSPFTWSAQDVDYSLPYDPQYAAANFNFFGFNQPYMRGAYHVVVTDNDDKDNDLLDDDDDKVLVTVTATLPGRVQVRIEAFVEYPVVTMNFTGMAAVVSQSDVNLLGNIEVDGRDYDMDNVLTGDPGLEGVITAGTMNRGGNAHIGGVGIAPNRPEPPGTYINNYPDPLPETPDEVVSLPEGKLKSIAQSAGTYFATEAEYDAYRAAKGGDLPGGQIYYLEFTFQNPTTFGNGINADPSIFVIHNSAGTASAKNIHGEFKGLLIVDVLDKVNAGTLLLGSVYCLSKTAPHIFGNGNADIHYSSEVLANLPSGTQSGSLNLLSYRKVK